MMNIERAEYEARHAELSTRLLKVETELTTNYKWIMDENRRIQEDVQRKFNTLAEKIDLIKPNYWKLIAMSLINFLVGGGLVEIINHFIGR